MHCTGVQTNEMRAKISNLANYRAENARECLSRETKNEIWSQCLKSFSEHSKFSLENSKLIFVPCELSFGSSRSWKQQVSRIIVTFRQNIAFSMEANFIRRKAKKSHEFRRKTFALLLHNFASHFFIL